MTNNPQPVISAAATDTGWVKLHRQLLHKPIWTATTPEQKVILMTLLMRVNYKASTWVHRGVVYQLNPGQLITSAAALAAMCGKGITDSKVRTALDLFKKYGFITSLSTKRNRLITIENWESYQSVPGTGDNNGTEASPSNDQGITNSIATNKKERSEKNKDVKNNNIPPPSPEAGDGVDPTKQQTPREKTKPLPPCPHDKILSLYNQHCPGLTPVKGLTTSRIKTLNARWKSNKGSLDAFQQLFDAAQALPYLTGTNKWKWKADIDWILKERNMTRILEGYYNSLQIPEPAMPENKPPTPRTGFHLNQSRGSQYTNQQLEELLLKRKPTRQPKTGGDFPETTTQP